MLLYAITQRSLFPGAESAREQALLDQARRLARGGTHYLQIREKDLPHGCLQSLVASLVAVVQAEGSPMKILLNGPPAVALKTGCHGIHLASDAPANAALDARRAYDRTGQECIISAACHSAQEISERGAHADLLLYSPIFEKHTPKGVNPGVGLSALAEAVSQARPTPVLALGGVTAHNAHDCAAAGAIGIAAIRLFLSDEWVPLLRP